MTKQEKIIIEKLVQLQMAIYHKAKILKIPNMKTISEMQSILINDRFVTYTKAIDNMINLIENKFNGYMLAEAMRLRNDIKASSLANTRLGFKVPYMTNREKILSQYQVSTMFDILKSKSFKKGA